MDKLAATNIHTHMVEIVEEDKVTGLELINARLPIAMRLDFVTLCPRGAADGMA